MAGYSAARRDVQWVGLMAYTMAARRVNAMAAKMAVSKDIYSVESTVQHLVVWMVLWLAD